MKLEIEQLEKTIKECHNKLSHFYGLDDKKHRLQTALFHALMRYAITLLQNTGKDLKVKHLFGAKNAIFEALTLGEILKVNSYHIATGHRTLAKVFMKLSKYNNEKLHDLEFLKSAGFHIDIACQLEPQIEGYRRYKKDIDDILIKTIKAKIKEISSEEEILDLKLLLFTLYQERNLLKEAAQTANQISSIYYSLVKATNIESNQIVEYITNSDFYIMQAISLNPDKGDYKLKKSFLYGKFIALLKLYLREYEHDIDERIKVSTLLLQFQRYVSVDVEAEANICRILSNLYMLKKTNFLLNSEERLQTIEKSHYYAEIAYNLNSENLNQFCNVLEIHAHNLRDIDPKKCFEYYHLCLNLAADKKVDEKILARCHDGLGNIYLNTNPKTEKDLLLARDHYFEVLRYETLLNDSTISVKHMLITTLMELGLFYERQYRNGDTFLFESIEKVYNEALLISQDNTELRKQALVENRLGNFYKYCQNIKKAYYYHFQAASHFCQLLKKSGDYVLVDILNVRSCYSQNLDELDNKLVHFLRETISDTSKKRSIQESKSISTNADNDELTEGFLNTKRIKL